MKSTCARQIVAMSRRKAPVTRRARAWWRAHVRLRVGALLKLSEHRDGLQVGTRSVRAPLRLAFLDRLRQVHTEAPEEPDLSQEIFIAVAMKDEPWRFVSNLRFNAI